MRVQAVAGGWHRRAAGPGGDVALEHSRNGADGTALYQSGECGLARPHRNTGANAIAAAPSALALNAHGGQFRSRLAHAGQRALRGVGGGSRGSTGRTGTTTSSAGGPGSEDRGVCRRPKVMRDQRIARQRLRNQRLAGAPFASPEEALRWLGASQAQEYAVAKWSLAQRASRHDDAALERALADGRILRTHVLRPTWHFVLPEDIRWIQALTGPRVQRLNASVYRRLELDDALLSRCRTVIERALEGGVHLTRRELAARLAEAGIQARGSRLAHIVMHLELDAVVCSGVPRGKQQTYALLEERAPRALRLEGDEALAELTRRYFRSRGPATLKDFRWWSSLTAAEAKRGVELIRSELEKVDADGRTYWFVPPLPPARAPAPRAHLLQLYDEYVVSYAETRDVVGVPNVLVTLGETLRHPIIADGRVVGEWQPRPGGKGPRVEARPWPGLDAADRAAVEEAVRRFERYAGVAAA